MQKRRGWAGIAVLLFAVTAANAALAQKPGGVLRVFHRDKPASMSILEEGSISAIMPNHPITCCDRSTGLSNSTGYGASWRHFTARRAGPRSIRS